MYTCPYCGCNNRPGTLFCDDCGVELDETAKHETVSSRTMATTVFSQQPPASGGTEPLDYAAVLLYVRDADYPISLEPNTRVILGRSDLRGAHNPDIDLTAFGAHNKGVSRLHAIVTCTPGAVTIADNGSTNGVFINGHRILPEQDYPLRDGDEIHLGQMVAHVYFE